MAGTVTQVHNEHGAIGVVTLTCIADAADGSYPDTALADRIGGRLLALETNPGTPAPTTLYDVTLVDADGHDVLEGVGANRHTTNTEKVAVVMSGTEIHPVIDESDTLTLNIDNNVVNSAVTVIKLYYSKGA